MDDKKTEITNLPEDDQLDATVPKHGQAVGKRATRKRMGKRLGITHSTVAKTFAFFMAILMLAVAAASVVAVVIAWNADAYFISEDDQREKTFRQKALNDSWNLILRVCDRAYGSEYADAYLDYSNIAYVKIVGNDPSVEVYEREISKSDEALSFDYYWYVEYDEQGNVERTFILGEDDLEGGDHSGGYVYTVTVSVASDLEKPDMYFWYDIQIRLVYAFRYSAYFIGFGALVLSVICFVFLMCAAGKRKGAAGVTPGVLTRIPFEIPTLLLLLLFFIGVWCLDSFSSNDIFALIVLIIWCVMLVVAGIFWCMSFALRVKLGSIFKNTIVYRICRIFWIAMRGVCRAISTFVRSIPLIWKTVILLAAVAVMEFFVIVGTWGEWDNLCICWLLWKIVSAAGIIGFAIMLRRLERGGREIANGNVDYKVDTRHLILDCKKHGEDLNRIGEGINIAVEERLRSERMKTELITNVSHDIKTPLTSIINYSDLICREECDNEKIIEYAGVLHNQSEKMKRLIDDLVEASKVSSGNIDILLAECDARVLIEQASGEYCQRLADAGLELVCSSPSQEIRIMADGRRIWRVFDNLMNNARKYALQGTRVYLSLEKKDDNAVFMLRNISREPLNIASSELTERFVRGDKSRNTEGNGLGLSIAKSLTELQGGSLDITVDGDLFKVTVTLPTVK